MKRIESDKEVNSKRKAIRSALVVLSILLLVVGIILLLIDPIKRMNRKRIQEDALDLVSNKIAASETDPVQMTYVVPKRGNEAEGEGYDFLSPEETEEEEDDYGYVTLTPIGILRIDAINISYTVWDKATQVSLRYGLGHYEDSVMPGEKGNATILGHNYRDGSMFHRLGDLSEGDEVEFTSIDGTVYVFHVVSSDIISADDLIDYALGNASTSRTLTLVTCTYEYGNTGWRRVVICELDSEYYDEEPEITVDITPETAPETTAVITTETQSETESEEDPETDSDTTDTENTP